MQLFRGESPLFSQFLFVRYFIRIFEDIICKLFKKPLKCSRKPSSGLCPPFSFVFLTLLRYHPAQSNTLGKLTPIAKLLSCNYKWLSNYLTGFRQNNP